MIETETDENVELSFKNDIKSGLNYTKKLISIIESNLDHEYEEVRKKNAIIATFVIKAIGSIDFEKAREIYKQVKEDKKNGH